MLDSELHTAYIGFGGNVGDVVSNIATARRALDELFRVNVLKHSSLYVSKPHGDVEQDDYINAVSAYHTSLSPSQLLKEMIVIENRLGRVREVRWGPRTIDIDLLLHGEQIVDTDILTLPHPLIYEREFVLYPLNEISPSLFIPEQGMLPVLMEFCPPNDLYMLERSAVAEA
ncbi:MAG: 2-amino-4-hydroxy-6-hydroxymethyldihydropteridine diphosphokinase [Gammaproteobacteria bacterium]|nr:2-amino-4-hydroxy-6-hydroxymethyldihydropteridine diphosphokinase [bacterium AH-315-E07]PCH60918.1 MAG: 2-amino-4-hydroxy-6-hydroxymethyldihydropteridine diphosphokinase [Gammaproteobacteria bacterium]